MKSLDSYRDHLGYIGHRRPEDGSLEFGDASNRAGLESVASHILRSENQGMVNRINVLLDRPEPVRHPDSRFWWGTDGRVGKDAMIPMLCSLVLNGDKDRLATFARKLDERGWIAWNTKEIWEDNKIGIPDVMKGDLFGDSVRALVYRFTATDEELEDYDFNLWMDATARVIYSYWKPDHTSDDLTFFTRLAAQLYVRPTKWVYKAGKTWFNCRKYPPEEAIRSYFKSENAPPLDGLIIPALAIIRHDLGLGPYVPTGRI